ncbi:MAG: hypothetical protein ACLF0P_02660 [Thermoanaerobaculia bacterium]
MGCAEEPEEPVARLRVPRAEVLLPYAASARLETAWRPLTPLGSGPARPAGPVEPVVFVHLLDDDGRILRTFDHPFPGPWTPLDPGDPPVLDAVELWQSALGPPLPPGRYRLTMGVVDPVKGTRWPLAVDGSADGAVDAAGGPPGEPVDRGEYAVATVVVPEGDEGRGVEVVFEGAWSPVEVGSDRQVLATRMLNGQGTLVFRGLTEPLPVQMVLRVPDASGGPARLVSRTGSEVPTVVVASECAREPVRLTGWGSHSVRLRLRPAGGAGECVVRLEPDFALIDPETLQRSAVQLRRLTWTQGGGAPPPESP